MLEKKKHKKKKTVGTPSSPSARSAVCLTAPAVKFIHLVEPGCIIDAWWVGGSGGGGAEEVLGVAWNIV